MLEDPDRKMRGFAALALLDRGYGKPKQPIEGESAQSLTLMHLTATREVGERIAAMIAQETTLQIEGEPVSQSLQSPSV